MSRPYRTPDDERDVFRALAHPVRRQIVAAALEDPQSFDQLRKRVRRSDATLAGHLRILRDAKLLVATRIGRGVNYHVNRSILRSCAQWLIQLAQPASPATGRN